MKLAYNIVYILGFLLFGFGMWEENQALLRNLGAVAMLHVSFCYYFFETDMFKKKAKGAKSEEGNQQKNT